MLDLIPEKTKLELAFQPHIDECNKGMVHHIRLLPRWDEDETAQDIYHTNRWRSLSTKKTRIETFLKGIVG